jgi:hypothetical protein
MESAGKLSTGKQSFDVSVTKKTGSCGDEHTWISHRFCCKSVSLLDNGLSQEFIDEHFDGVALTTKSVEC